VLLLLAGFGLFLVGFLVYSHYLGNIDGLPQLSEELGPNTETSDPPDLVPVNPLNADKKLVLAFGDREDLQKMPIKLDVNSKNLVLASEEFKILEDGRVRLTPFYLAVFGKNTDNKFPEINTIKGDVAFLTFDQPVKSITEISNRKIRDGELTGNIYVKNNRRTPQTDDDLSMTTQGPLYYREDQHLIWTKASVRMLDTQTKPEPTVVTADGMDLLLTTERPEDKTAPHPAKPARKQTVSGVDSIALRSNVDMYLTDTGSGFLASSDRPKKSKPAEKPVELKVTTVDPKTGEKTSMPYTTQPQPKPPTIIIKTPGPFHYDVKTDHARFDIPSKRGALPETVSVTRLSQGVDGQIRHDKLFCDHLELQFQRKADGAAPEGGEHQMNLVIQNAHATGKEVTLDSESEELHALGDDFFYDADKKEIILKGTPDVAALKEGHEIYAPEMHIVNAGEKDSQQVQAKGRGHVALLDKATAKRNHFAYWRDEAYFIKEADFDCLTLTGEARFEDKENNQQLGADRLKVWLEPQDKDQDKAPQPAAANSDRQRMRPHHLEGTGHVFAVSPDLRIVAPTEHLMVWFRDVLPGNATSVEAQSSALDAAQPGAVVAPPTQPAPAQERAASKPIAQPVLPSEPQRPATAPTRDRFAPKPVALPGERAPAAQPSQLPAKPKPPLDVSARDVECFVRRTGEKNDIEKVRCNGDVHVHQEPQEEDDKGVDIRGNVLQLNQYPDGGVLVVTGNMAVVQLNKITIAGDEVNINQRTNEAWVPCRGWMKMLSNSSLADVGARPEEKPQPAPAAKKPEKPKELTIHWNHDMFFDGSHALFNGGVQATQENSRLTCIDMRVFLDKPVSLKEGQKGSEPARVKKVVCDRSVRTDDLVLDTDGKLVRKSRLIAPLLAVDNEDGEGNASGPGVVYLLQYGSEDDMGGGPTNNNQANGTAGGPRPGPGAGQPARGAAQPAPGARPPAVAAARPTPGARPPAPGAPTSQSAGSKQELKVTRIVYRDRLYSNNNKRTATFFGGVEVINLPTENMDIVVDVDHPPKGCLHMKCEQLKVFSHKLPDGRASQEMEAMRHVVVQSQEFWGNADVVKYDESKDLVILEGGEGGKATLYRERAQGGAPDRVRGARIYYWRRLNEFKIDKADSLDYR
jgi:lipopolysaccharide export system protein LptA